MSYQTATELGVIRCNHCGLVCRAPDVPEGAHCPRCDAGLKRRKPASLARSWALLITAAILYIPANLLPIMVTSTILDAPREDTIVSGVIVLWEEGSWDIALIVFVASVVVPVLKILILGFLLISVQRSSNWRPLDRARLFQIIEKVGHWSMLDVFVVALLVALVKFKSYATVEAGPAIVAFGAVVVVTMLAAKSFDPRLIWDAPDRPTPNDKRETSS